MRVWLRGRVAAGVCPKSAAVLSAMALALALAGCASTAEQAGPPQAVAQAGRMQHVEEDGLPPQVAPPMRARTEPDDPTEPYSPNYGGASVPTQSHLMPMPMLQPTPTRMSLTEQEAVIAAAITAHEMRNP